MFKRTSGELEMVSEQFDLPSSRLGSIIGANDLNVHNVWAYRVGCGTFRRLLRWLPQGRCGEEGG